MIKMAVLSAFVAFGAADAAGAATLPVPGMADAGLVQVAEGCGPGSWRSGLDNACRRLGPYAHGVPGYACPAGWRAGPRGGACWPNR